VHHLLWAGLMQMTQALLADIFCTALSLTQSKV